MSAEGDFFGVVTRETFFNGDFTGVFNGDLSFNMDFNGVLAGDSSTRYFEGVLMSDPCLDGDFDGVLAGDFFGVLTGDRFLRVSTFGFTGSGVDFHKTRLPGDLVGVFLDLGDERTSGMSEMCDLVFLLGESSW